MKPFRSLLLVVVLELLFTGLAIGEGILPSWMRRDRAVESPQPSIAPQREVVIVPLPPEIRNLAADGLQNSSAVVIRGEVLAQSAIHSITLNGEALEHSNGVFRVEKEAVIGKNDFVVVATDSRGQTTTLNLSYVFKPTSVTAQEANVALNPKRLKTPDRFDDAVALVIGIENYPALPSSAYSARDAEFFSKYATSALRVSPKKVKLLTNEQATKIGILKAIDLWLKSEVTASTRVYVFYSGHGLSSPDGETGFIVPSDVDLSYLGETGISIKNLFQRISNLKPRETVAFLDSCYSGQSRGGPTLLANARPIAMRTNKAFGDSGNTSIFMASSGMELANSDEKKRHGLFSYYMMKGLEGEADLNKDGTIDTTELLEFIRKGVFKDATLMGRSQTAEYVGRPLVIR